MDIFGVVVNTIFLIAPLLHRQAEQYNTTCAGSLRWCAPESMKPKLAATVYGQKVDIYSYGVILWELATREWPYADFKFDFEVSTCQLAI